MVGGPFFLGLGFDSGGNQAYSEPACKRDYLDFWAIRQHDDSTSYGAVFSSATERRCPGFVTMSELRGM
jgi:hypothetical protein